MRKVLLSTLVLVMGISAFASSGRTEDQEARQILQRALEAAGGERSLAKLKLPMLWMERGTFHGMGQTQPFVGQYAAKWPSWYREEIENAFAITARGDQVWVSGAAGVQKLTGPLLEERLKLVRLAWAERLFPLAETAYQLDGIDGIQVDGRETVGIKARHTKQGELKLFFDKDTYLLAKIETLVVSPQHGPDPIVSEALFSDYKSFGGVMIASRRRVYYDNKLFLDAETVDYKMAATLDPEQFEEPE